MVKGPDRTNKKEWSQLRLHSLLSFLGLLVLLRFQHRRIHGLNEFHVLVSLFQIFHAQSTCHTFHQGRFIDDTGFFSVEDRKSTRLNSSHVSISYAVFCLKKKKLYI